MLFRYPKSMGHTNSGSHKKQVWILDVHFNCTAPRREAAAVRLGVLSLEN
jgi:hypothetical protein